MEQTKDYPQIKKRKIGQLNIIDIQGNLFGPWALRVKKEISSLIGHQKNASVVINLRPVQGIDSLGVKAILESLPPDRALGFLVGSLSVMDMINRASVPEEVHLLKNEEDLATHFGKEMVQEEEHDPEQRKSLRMNTALPLIFKCQSVDQISYEFRAIVTSLSEGGLFAEYIDLTDAVKSQSFVNPYELKMLQLELKLPNHQAAQAKGKVVRRKLDGDQVGIGIEFYEVEEKSLEKIQKFLNDGID